MSKYNYNVEVKFRTREQKERRHTVSQKLARVINLESGTAAVR